MLLIGALALIVIFALFVTAVLRPPARPAALLSVYLLAYANVVFAGQIANSFYQLNNRWWFLALHLLLALGAVFLWWFKGKPSLRAPWLDEEGRLLPAGLRISFKTWPEIWLLGLGVLCIFLLNANLLWVTAPNNNDSLATHMSRVGYWLQRGSFFPWPSSRIWQITYPVNMQLQMFWTVLFLGTDRIVESIQWLGALAAMVAAFGLARLLGATRPQAFFAAFLWATFPNIILEATTTQNDLVAGTLFAAMLYLLFLGLYRRHTGTLILSGVAMGLALGTKQTLVFLLPGLALALGLTLLYCGRAIFPWLFRWGVSSAAAFLLLGVYMFVVNMVHFGHPMGPENAVNAQTGGQNQQSLMENLVFNTFRLAYQSVDPTGLPDPICGYSFKAKGMVTGKVLDLVGFPVEEPIAVAEGHRFVLRERYVLSEDAAWFGPVFALLVLPALFYQLVVGLKRKDPLRVGIFILALSFLLLDAAFRPGWDPFQGRYFIPVVTVATPLAAFAVRPGRFQRLLRLVVIAIALTVATNTFLLNSGKPVSGEKTVWTMDRIEQSTLQSFYMRDPARLVERYIPADSTLGLLTYGTFLEYPFFQEDFSRRLVQIHPTEQSQNVSWLKAQGIEFVVVLAPKDVTFQGLPDALVPVASQEEWTIYTWVK